MEGQEKRNELMVRAQDGDASAYRDLLNESKRMAAKFFSSRVASQVECEDLVQKVLMRIHQYRHTFIRKGSYDSWMYAIARNVLYDFFKRVSVPMCELDQVAGELSTFPEQEALNVKFALEKLNDASREALLGARTTRPSTSALKVRAHRAYQKLKKYLMDEDL